MLRASAHTQNDPDVYRLLLLFTLLLHAGCYSTRFRTVSKRSDWLLSSIRRCEIGQRTNLSRKMAKTTLFDNLKEIFCFRARKWEKITVLNSSPSRTILGIISFFPSSFFLFYPIFALNKLELPVYSNEAFLFALCLCFVLLWRSDRFCVLLNLHDRKERYPFFHIDKAR